MKRIKNWVGFIVVVILASFFLSDIISEALDSWYYQHYEKPALYYSEVVSVPSE